GRFAAAGDDPGSRVMGTPSAPVWRLWNLDGSLRQTGSNDPPGCPNGSGLSPVEDCSSRATRIALSRDGTRIAVAGQTGAGGTSGNGDAVIGLFSDSGASVSGSFPMVVSQVTVNALDLSQDGAWIAMGGSRPPANGAPQDTADGYLTTINSGGTAIIANSALEDPVVAVALNSVGSRLVAGAGPHIRANPSADTLYHNVKGDQTSAVQGNVRSVDISDHTAGWSVAGYDSGFFAVFSDGQGNRAPSVQDYQKREAGDSSALAGVAIRPNATAFVTGSAAGRLRLYTMDPAINPELNAFAPTMASTLDNAGAVIELAFSGDGRYLAARAGGGIRFYDTQGNTLTELWRDDRASMANSVAIDQRGEHVAAAVGSTVILYDAIHKMTPTLPSATQAPGATTTHTVTYRNDGNRADKVDLTASPPSGISVSLVPSSFLLKPGQSQAVQASVSVPSTQAPGTLTIPLITSLNGGTDGTASNNLVLTVPTVRDVRLEPQGATSKGANGGQPATFDVRVRNAGNVQESVALAVGGAPAGWGVTVTPTSLVLPAGSYGNVTVSMQPPNGSRDGLAATAILRRDGGAATPVELTATVGAFFQVRLVVPVGTVIDAGVSGLVNATVHNEGNALDTINVRISALPAGWRGGFLNGLGELEVADVEPGGNRVVQISLQPPEDAASSVPVQITVIASSLGDPSRTSSKGILVTVNDPNAVSETDTSSDEGGGGKGTPGPGPVLLLAALALAALAVRRRQP
ncbi:MAG: NPCBM-associated, domain of alpha-galactosidase, partial [Thermoplasmata archaeon]|nr:NPCBM-associated, domain of alpha-galactosidase [Thermoplasmata archaeon]